MDHIKLTHDKLSVEVISDLVASPKCGAISLFMGTTRDNFEGKSVVTLEYEVYESMAMKALQSICVEIRNKWSSIENIAIYHRLGNVPVKEASIVIATSSPHRQDAIEATQWCIDNVKQSVPIWKKEIYSENPPEWKENKESSTYPPRIHLFKLDKKPEVKVPFVYPHHVQINANEKDINQRIEKFIERKRDEINQSNIRDFCGLKNINAARIDAKLVKRKDSKGHLQVNRVYNTYQRDQDDFEYMKVYNPKSGIEERLKNIEVRLGFDFPVNKNIYEKLRILEDRILYLESVSPEYAHLWEKSFLQKTLTKKRVYTINEIDNLIFQLEAKRTKSEELTNQVAEDAIVTNR